jgi:hypothetical protein
MAMPMVADFTEYAVKETKEAFNARQALPAELQKVLEKIRWELADDPMRYPERTSSLGRAGGVLLYRHPHPAIEITFEVDEPNHILYFFHFVAPALPARQTVFISYSHKDRKWIELLRKVLGALEQDGVLKLWDDRDIKAGERWEDSIREALDSARAAVLLVSQDFLVSDFITRCELPRLLAAAERDGKRIFWIPVGPSTVFETHKEITSFQSPLADPRVSLKELRKADRTRALAQVRRRVAEALLH